MRDALMEHYRTHARILPWRIPPGEDAPDGPAFAYRVWLSEIMLQQTTVAAVKGHFQRFTALWPTVGALAGANEEDVMREWAGLGYYARARNLIKTARQITAGGGRFPKTEAELSKLPGIGPYTSAAIASIAFGQRAIVIDGNVERIASRLGAIETPLPQARSEIAALLDQLTPTRKAGDFAQAMMDLGAAICTPRNPQCHVCPIAFGCVARELGRQTDFPVKAAKKAKPSRTGTAYWIESEGKVALIRRPDKGMLGGMRALPSDDWDRKLPTIPDAVAALPNISLGLVTHVFTHFNLSLSIVAVDGNSCQAPVTWEWWPIEELDKAGLPTLFAKGAALGRAAQKEMIC